MSIRRCAAIVSLLCAAALSACQSRSSSTPAYQAARDDSYDPATTARLTVYGMSCPLCAHNIEQQLTKVRGVQGVRIDLGEGLVFVTVDTTRMPSREQLYAATHASGFTVKDLQMPTPPTTQPAGTPG